MLQNGKFECKICEVTEFTFAYIQTYVLVAYLYA
jgi:hypothetical protein